MRVAARQEHRKNLKEVIIDTAWELFFEKGYKNTTINDIIERSGTSKGGFYYYFNAKDDLLNSLYEVFDREYEKFYRRMDKTQNSLVQLEQLSQYAAYFIEANVMPDLLAELYISQLTKKTQEHFLSPDRYYIKLVGKIIREGQEKNEIRDDMSVEALTHDVLLLERGIFTDWCVQNGKFPLGYYGAESFNRYIEFMKK